MAQVGRPPTTLGDKQFKGTAQARHRRKALGSPGRRKALPRPSSRDYGAIAAGYETAILAGTIPACQWVKLACARQSRDRLRAEVDPAWPYVWSEAQAAEACQFLEHLPHVEGTWDSPTLQLEPCQVWLVSLLFGWRQRAHPARRRFTTLYFEVGRKAAKSTLMAGIALYHLLREHEPGAQVICGATTGSQARIVFGIAQRMVTRSRWLLDQGLLAMANAIIAPTANMKPIAANSSVQDGLNPSCIVLDESHAQKFSLHDVLKSAQGARVNPLLLCPTTAGYDMLSVGYALRTTVTKILQQVVEAEHVLGIIYTLDEGDDWRDPAVWIKANPMLGITPRREWVTQYCLDAQQTPGLEGEFRVKVCSEWMQAGHAWLSVTQWMACADPTLTLEQFRGERCWIGGDLAQLDDLAAVALCFERQGLIYAFARFYLPRDVVEMRARAVPAYLQWARSGILTMTDGNMIDYNQIERDIRAWCRQFNVQALRFDQYGSAGIVASLAGDGFPAAILDKSRKAITPPARELEARIQHRRIRHDGNACLAWMISNAVVTRGIDDSIIPKKDLPESPNKIDGVDALLQAMSAMVGPKESVPEFAIQVW